MSSMNINDALKELYLALGGNSSAFKNGMTVTDYTALLKNVLSGGGGSGLPEVTEDDNGDILKVIGGEWSKAKNLGPDKFDVTYADSEFDRTSAEIIAAFEAGKTIRFMVAAAVVSGVGDSVVMTPSNFSLDESGDLIELGFIAVYKTNSSNYATTVFRIDLTETDPTLSYANIDIT